MDERLGSDFTLGAWLKELQGMEVFSAQTELENRILTSSRSKLESLSLTAADLSLEYVKIRSEIDTIKKLQEARRRLIEDRNQHRDPALKERSRNV